MEGYSDSIHTGQVWGKPDPNPYFSDKAVEAQKGMEVYSLSPSKVEQRGTDLAGISSLPTNLPMVRTRFTTYNL